MSRSEKTKQRRLNRKRRHIRERLKLAGQTVNEQITDAELIKLGYEQSGKKVKPISYLTHGQLHAFFDAILRWSRKWGDGKPKQRAAKTVNEQIAEFYRSYEWRQIRYIILAKYGAECMLRGATRADGLSMHVDHIKPLRFFWDLRLDKDNLQVLCEICNHGKGNWDRTDWRPSDLSGA